MRFARWRRKRKRSKNIHDGIRAHLSNGMKPLNDLSNGYRARWHWSTHTTHFFGNRMAKKKICRKQQNPKSQKRTSLSGELTWLQSNRFKRWMSGCVFRGGRTRPHNSDCLCPSHRVFSVRHFHLVISFRRFFILVFLDVFAIISS